MARSLSQTITKLSLLRPKSPQQPPPQSLTIALRSQSNQPTDPVFDIDPTTTDPDLLAFRKIQDAIHTIIVRRSAPDWLPFVPGASYWVPPRRGDHGFSDLIGKFAFKLDEDDALSRTTERGWPSSAYFAKGESPHEFEVETTSNMSQFEDEEG